MPTRTIAYFSILYKYYWRDQGGHLNQMRKLLFINLGLAFFDFLNIFPLIYDLLMPTRYAHIIRALDIQCIKKWKLKQLERERNANMAQMPQQVVPTVPAFSEEDAELDEKQEDHDKYQLLPGQGDGDGHGHDMMDIKLQLNHQLNMMEMETVHNKLHIPMHHINHQLQLLQIPIMHLLRRKKKKIKK